MSPPYLPPATAFFILVSLFGPAASAHALAGATPRPTTTLPHRSLRVVPWPTPAPLESLPGFGVDHDLLRLLLRRQDTNTICGYIGGNKNLPATCSAGSHCVLAPDQKAVGCCPNGGACTTGIFTGCVDVNSPAQTVVNPYVYTCGGDDVCYKNVYAGGYSQYGCGTASGMATTVEATLSDVTLTLSSQHISFTEPIITLTRPTTIGSPPPHSPSSHPTTRPTTDSSASSSASSSSSPSSRPTNLPTHSSENSTSAPIASNNGADNSAAIIGGTISGAALLLSLIVVGYVLWRRRRGNQRDGPGQPHAVPVVMPPKGPLGFSPVQLHEEHFDGPPPPPTAQYDQPYQQPHQQPHYQDEEYGAGDDGIYEAPSGMHSAMAGGGAGQREPYHSPNPGAIGGAQYFEGDSVPLNRGSSDHEGEMEEFRQGYHQAMSGIHQDDDEQGRGDDGSQDHLARGSGSGDGTGRPLWQQNRQQSRTMMWI